MQGADLTAAKDVAQETTTTKERKKTKEKRKKEKYDKTKRSTVKKI